MTREVQGPITPERFVDIVIWTRSVMDAHDERNGVMPRTAIEPPVRTAVMVRHGIIADDIAPDWLAAEDWQRWIEW